MCFFYHCYDVLKHFTLLSLQLLFKVWSRTCKTNIVLTFIPGYSVCLSMQMSCVCVCVCMYMYMCVCIYISALMQYPVKFRYSADHCGHLIMLPNSKNFRNTC